MKNKMPDAFRYNLNMLSYDMLRVTVLELVDAADMYGLTDDVIGKVLTTNFAIFLAAQRKCISFAEYVDLVSKLITPLTPLDWYDC